MNFSKLNTLEIIEARNTVLMTVPVSPTVLYTAAPTTGDNRDIRDSINDSGDDEFSFE